jgi:glycosyltransferase involved in cell wall biosynthesis
MRRSVVASDIGGINEVAIPGLTALPIPPGDDNALATAILELYANREKGRFLAGNGRKMVEERYSLEYMLDSMERVYRETLKYPDLL